MQYFFDFTDEPFDERSSVVLSDVRAARHAGARFLGEVLMHEPNRLDHGSVRLSISDAARAELFAIEVRLSEPGVAAAA